MLVYHFKFPRSFILHLNFALCANRVAIMAVPPDTLSGALEYPVDPQKNRTLLTSFRLKEVLKFMHIYLTI